MNVHTFKDVGKRDSLAHDVEDADEDQIPAVRMKGTVEGEEESDTKFNDIGEVMEPFNLKEERETGFYDESGNYVFRDEKHQEVDAWVADLDEATMERAIGESARAQQKKRQREDEEEIAAAKKVDRPLNVLKAGILALMQPGETVTRAMKRMSQATSQLRQNSWKKKTSSSSAVTPATTGGGSNKNAAPLEGFIELVDACISQHGLFHVYELTFEALQTSLSLWEYYVPSASASASSSAATAATPQVFGPFTSQQIAQWKSQHYLTGATAVFMRRYVPSTSTSTSTGVDVGVGARVGVGATIEGVKKASMSMFDDDDEDDEKKEETPSTAINSVVGDDSGISSNPWIHSDSIDFGAYVADMSTTATAGGGTTSALGMPLDSESDEDEDNNKPPEDGGYDSDV